MDLITYLAFDGQCEAAFKHYEKVLGGKILMMMRGSDAPAGTPISPDYADKIMHARLQVGSRLLMGGDAPSGRAVKPQGFCSNIQIEDPVEAERIFRQLGEGGQITMPIGETFWARRFGMLTDRFGVPWMVNCERPSDAAQSTGKPFVISRTFDVPRETLWACFTDAERMRQWWGPKGVTIIASKMDLRPGGTYHYGMRTADGMEMWGRMIYREIDPLNSLVLINSFSNPEGGLGRHPLAPTWPVEMHTTFTFTDAGAGKSTFKAVWTPWNATQEEQATFDAGHESMTGGWTGTLDRLTAYLSNRA